MESSRANRSLNILYPPRCEGCQKSLEISRPLCEVCAQSIELLTPLGRCTKCFSEIAVTKGVCVKCRKIPHPFDHLAYCFPPVGAGKALVHAFVHRGHYWLGKDLAAFAAIQLNQLGWRQPDLIVSKVNKNDTLLAKELSALIDCPYRSLLHRSYFHSSSFFLKKKCNIINQFVLWLATEAVSIEKMHAAGWVLHEGGPQAIVGLSLCTNSSY